MAWLSTFCLFTSIVIWALPVVLATYYPDIIRGDNPCGTTFHVALDAVLIYGQRVTPRNRVCYTKFASKNGFSLIARFLVYYMDPHYDSEEGNCSFESIQLYNVSGSPLLGPGIQYCSVKFMASAYFLGASGKFVRTVIQREHFQLVNPVLVNILLTEVIYKNTSCPSGYFDCGNDYCVNKVLLCNKYDDCGNNVDEGHRCMLSQAAVAAVLSSFFIIIMLLIIVCFVLYKEAISKL